MQGGLVFFDGFCNLCSRSVQMIIKFDRHNRFQFASLQGKTASAYIPHNQRLAMDSIVLYCAGKLYTKSTAVLRIARGLQFPVNMLAAGLIIPAIIRDKAYDFISARRYKWYGRKTACYLPDAQLSHKFLE